MVWSFPYVFSDQNILCISGFHCLCCMFKPTSCSSFSYHNTVRWVIQVVKLPLCYFLHFIHC